ncbi:hypothetical protein L7F22_049750 [Adiantum nelumboides]|nr:hypothetical protein [Adiantum nelumboides]
MAFRNVEACSSEGREKHAIVADLDGTLTRGRSSFPYFMLMAIEGGSMLRGAVLMLVASIVWLLYHFVSKEADVKVLIFVSFAGLKVKDIEGVIRAVLPKFYTDDIPPESWRVFSSCYFNRCVVTANPRIMVEFFCENHLGADKVLGSEIQVTNGGQATGLLLSPGVLLGDRKRHFVKAEFGDQALDVGLGDRDYDHPFICARYHSFSFSFFNSSLSLFLATLYSFIALDLPARSIHGPTQKQRGGSAYAQAL